MYFNKTSHLTIISILILFLSAMGSVIHGSPKPQTGQRSLRVSRIGLFDKLKVSPSLAKDDPTHTYNWKMFEFPGHNARGVFITGDREENDKWAVDGGIRINVINVYIIVGIRNGYSQDDINKARRRIPDAVKLNASDITYMIPEENKYLENITITFELMDAGKVNGNTDIFILKMKGKSIVHKQIFYESELKEYNKIIFGQRQVSSYSRTKGERIFISGSKDGPAKWAVDDALLIRVAKKYSYPGTTGLYPRTKKYIPDKVKQNKLDITGIIPKNTRTLLLFELFDRGEVSANTDIYLSYEY